MNTQLDLMEVERKPSRSRLELLLAIAEKGGYSITYACGCCEPGYDDKEVVLANWNSKTRYDKEANRCVEIDDTMPRLAKIFEKLGYAVEWEDEWSTCEDCGKVFRTSPDSYSWTPHYAFIGECCLVCGDCIKDNPADYLESLSGDYNKAETLGIDLSEHGYVKRPGNYQSGWYGREDKPADIAKKLKKEGVTDFIFTLDSQGQFALDFSVWVKE